MYNPVLNYKHVSTLVFTFFLRFKWGSGNIRGTKVLCDYFLWCDTSVKVLGLLYTEGNCRPLPHTAFLVVTFICVSGFNV